MNRLGKRWRFATTLVGLVMMLLAFAPRIGATVTAPKILVSLAGTGSFDPYEELVSWDNDLFSSGIDPGYIPLSGYLGRQQLISGAVDYAISGVPFSSDQLAELPGGAKDLITAPVFVSALSVLMSPPIADGYNGFDTEQWPCDPNQVACQLQVETAPTLPSMTPYKGPINAPPPELAAMMLDNVLPLQSQTTDESNDEVFNYDEWDNPDILSASGALGTDDVFVPSALTTGLIHALYPKTVVQAGAAEQNYYAEKYASTAAPTQWTGIEQYAQGISSFSSKAPSSIALSEFLPGQIPFGQVSEQGLRQAVGELENQSANVALVSPSGLYQFNTDVAANHTLGAVAQWIGVQNASDQYVDPSAASIDAAVDAGGDTPFYALTNKVTGGTPAYPLTYIDDLYAPAHGLSQEKTEALATLIRYLATAGQEYTANFGDGRLSPSLTQDALSAANQLVLSNCTGTGTVVTQSSNAGPYMPQLPAGSAGAKDIAAIGSMLNCEEAPPPTTTTTTAITTTTTAHATTTTVARSTTTTTTAAAARTGSSTTGTGSGGSSTGSSSTTTTLVRTAVGAHGASPTGGTHKTSSGTPAPAGPISLVDLPVALPGSTFTGFDRLTELAIGAALFLLGRRPAQWLLRIFKS